MSEYLFNCEKSNEKSLYDNFNSYFISTIKNADNSDFYIGSNIYFKEAICEEIEIVMGNVQREWFLFQSVALYDDIVSYDDMKNARTIINKSLVGITESLQICECPLRKERYNKNVLKGLKCLYNSLIPINSMKDDFVIKLSTWKNGDFESPIYQYFHTLLEMEYYLLFLNTFCGAQISVIKEMTQKIMNNFIQFHKINFQRQSENVFVCRCIKNFWLLLQLFFEKTNTDTNYFWELFNEELDNEDPMFSLWLLSEIAGLQLIGDNMEYQGNICSRIRTNYILLQNKLKSLLAVANSDKLLKLFKVLHPLLSDYWLKNAKIEIYQTIWDFYSKRLNISKANYTNLSALDLDNILDHIISSPGNCKEDFELFVGILIIHLNKYPSHWGKIKGRIYSQLGPHKLKDLNEVGIARVMFLFSSLSTLNYEELLKKIISFFEGLPQEKKYSSLTWNILTIVIFMQVRRGFSVEKTAPILLSWIQEGSLDHKNFHLIKSFISNFEHILNFSLNMQLDQWIFLHTWLNKYLSTCYYADMCTALDTLLITLEKVKNPDSWSFWCSNFINYVYPVLKQIAVSQKAPRSVGKIAGKLYLITPHMFEKIFTNFTNENISPKVALHFLIVALGDYPNSCILSSQQELLVIQTWFKICFLLTELCEFLTKIVTKLDYFPVNLKSYLNSSDNSINAFIEYLASDLDEHIRSSNIYKLCEISFGSVDKWLNPYLNNPEKESVVLKIYNSLALAFLHCGILLYQRNKSSSPLTRLIECLLLPSDLLKGKNINEHVLNCVKKTWHIFYEALVKLKNDTDMFLERTLRDLITKYMPHFSTSESPIIKCLQNEATAGVVLEKISTSYFKQPVKESDNNLIKVITILKDSVESTTSIILLRLIVTKVVEGLFELFIFHPQRNLAVNLIKVITTSALYPDVSDNFSDCILSTTKKYLGFYATNCFQLMYIIARFIPKDVKKLIGKITQQIKNVEMLRGVGYDRNLRIQLEKLEELVNTM